MINCVIVDDDLAYSKLISTYLRDYDSIKVKGVFNDPLAAKKYLLENEVDLLFLDMQMPELLGLDLIKSLPDPPHIIIITSHRDFAVESYNANAVDYLIKPLDKARFGQAIEKAIARVEQSQASVPGFSKELKILPEEPEYFVLRADRKFFKVRYSEILYLEAMGDMVKIHLPDKHLIAMVNLKYMENFLPQDVFIRIHRSFIANVRQVTSFDAYEVWLGSRAFPLGQQYKDKVTDRIVGQRLIKKE